MKELQEELGKLAKQIRTMSDKVNAEKRDFTAEEKPNWEKLNSDFDALKARIDVAKRADEVKAYSETPAEEPIAEPIAEPKSDDKFDATSAVAGSDEDRTVALQGWFRVQSGMEPRKEHIDAAKRVGMRLGRNMVDIKLNREKRDLTVTTTAGGYTIAQGFVPRLEQAMLAYGNVEGVAEVLRTTEGNNLPWPTGNDTSNTGVLLAINTTIGNSVDPTFGQFSLDAYKFSSTLIKVPPELLEDSAFDMAGVIADMLGVRLGRVKNTYFTTGTGTAQPNGIVTGSYLGKTTASATAITWDEVLDLVYSVDDAYLAGAGFMMNKAVELYLRKLKGGDGQYIWQAGVTAGAPNLIYGYPVNKNTDMASAVSASAKTMLFGQLSAYKVREVNGVRLRRLVERYADTDQEGFVAFIRADGDLLNAGTNPVKHMIQHA